MALALAAASVSQSNTAATLAALRPAQPPLPAELAAAAAFTPPLPPESSAAPPLPTPPSIETVTQKFKQLLLEKGVCSVNFWRSLLCNKSAINGD